MTITVRQVKGSGLTNAEIDANFVEKVTRAGNGFAAGDLVKVDATDFAGAQADAAANRACGVVVAASGDDFYVSLRPCAVTKTAHGYGSRGTRLWLSQGTAKAWTPTKPSTGVIQPVGQVLDANTILFQLEAWQEI